MCQTKRVVIVEPGKLPAVSFIGNSLEAMQKAVGGFIELFETTESGIDLFCNDEGKLVNMEMNRFFPELQDIICGPILAIGHDGEEASVSLTDEQVREAVEMFTHKYSVMKALYKPEYPLKFRIYRTIHIKEFAALSN